MPKRISSVALHVPLGSIVSFNTNATISGEYTIENGARVTELEVLRLDD